MQNEESKVGMGQANMMRGGQGAGFPNRAGIQENGGSGAPKKEGKWRQ